MRRVQVSIGSPSPAMVELAPPGLRELIAANQMEEGYCVIFINKEGDDGMVAYMACLCPLHEVTEAWLQGCSLLELENILRQHATDHQPGGDEGRA